jgi:hypothetical protein
MTHAEALEAQNASTLAIVVVESMVIRTCSNWDVVEMWCDTVAECWGALYAHAVEFRATRIFTCLYPQMTLKVPSSILFLGRFVR